jgi:hypothetical protein
MALFGAFVLSKRFASSPVASNAVERPKAAAPTLAPPTVTIPPGDVAPIAPTSTLAEIPVTSRSAPSNAPAPAARTKAPTVARSPAKVRPFDGDSRTAEQRSRVLSLNEPGTLTFEANVPALVTFDGRSLGSTPKSVTAAPGNHTVVFVHPELGEKAHAVTLDPGQDKTIRATFEPRGAD